MFKNIIFILFLLITFGEYSVRANEKIAYSENQIINQYINEGLENNLALKQKIFSFKKSMQALKEARGMFMPSIGIHARYSRAGGGRIIEFPVGDLMNPVYDAINDTRVNTGLNPMPFPHLENEYIPFLREEEHDTKIRAVQPLIQPALYYNYKIKSDLKRVNELEVIVYKRHLITDIKTSYFNFLKIVQIEKLLDETKQLLDENLRVSKKLFETDKATKDVVYRAQAEISKIEQHIEEARKNRKVAQSYFNFLLNRPLKTEIQIAENFVLQSLNGMDIDAAEEMAIRNREELKQLEEVVDVAEHSKGLSTSAFLPGLSVVADYGYQGEEYKFDSKNDYWMISGILQWNLFNGFQDKAKREQAEIEKKKAETKLLETKKLISLQVEEASNNLTVSGKSLISAKEQVKSARESFKIIKKKYKEGMAAQIEYLDARKNLTSAEINNIISKYDYFINQAELERVTAKFLFE